VLPTAVLMHKFAHAMGRKHVHRAALALPASFCAWS
jgi:hypothetical protein